MVLHPSGMLSLALAKDIGSTPAGILINKLSANGTLNLSVTIPPHGPKDSPNPKPEIKVSPALRHFVVRPDKQCEQLPHEMAHGTITLSPTLILFTSSPQERISATHS